MKIILDSQVFDMQRYGGISRYYTEIFSILANKDSLTIKPSLVYTNNVYFKESTLLTNNKSFDVQWLQLLDKAGFSIRKKIKKLNRSKTKKSLLKEDFDLFIPTYYDPYFLDHLNNKPFVLTVYDMIHELFPEHFSDGEELKANKLLLMEQAAKIIAVSQNTKRDILKLYPHIDEAKIEVIYHGTSIKINENSDVKLPANYILYVGSRAHYKNFRFLADSIKELLQENPDLHLVCAGGGKLTKTEIEFIKELGLENQILQIDFEENDLGYFYRNAKCFVFPSMYEGFGIPVLESMVCGCPIVLGNHSSFPEVAGNAGVYFNIEDKLDLKNKIQSLLQNEDLRKEFKTKGLEQAKKFTWENAAEQCLNLYQRACLKN